MFKRRTLFIVGAGASQEVGFPLGTTLARSIGQRLIRHVDQVTRETNYNDSELYGQLRRTFPNEINEYFVAARRIAEGIQLANSIDEFLNIHGDNERVKTLGKAAIVRSILGAERNSNLFVDQSNIYNKLDFSRVEDTWFVKLMRVLGPDVPLKHVEGLFDQVMFIVFNYDRCLEHFLIHALHALYGIGVEAATRIVANISIVHPYGTVGELESVPFGGSDVNEPNCFQLASRIKTYTEQIGDGGTVESMHEMMQVAQCIVFLGFAYGEQNMDLLKSKTPIERKPVFGTAYGLSKSDREAVSARILQMMKPPQPGTLYTDSLVQLGIDVKCARLFDEYARSLNAA
jgi:hypothetical protein